MLHYDAVAWKNISATAFPSSGRPTSSTSSNGTTFSIQGGFYMLTGVATWGGGNIEIQKLGPDGSTMISLATPMKLTANGEITAYLPPGQYQLTVTTATAIYAELTRIPTL